MKQASAGHGLQQALFQAPVCDGEQPQLLVNFQLAGLCTWAGCGRSIISKLINKENTDRDSAGWLLSGRSLQGGTL